jgi:hypothetical protein
MLGIGRKDLLFAKSLQSYWIMQQLMMLLLRVAQFGTHQNAC